MFSKDGVVWTIHFESVVENIKKCMLTLRRLLRSRPELNSGTAHIFWYIMDELVLLVSSWDFVFAWLPWTFSQMCLYHFRFLDLRFTRKSQPQHAETLRGIQPVEDPTVEPPPSEKQYKRAVLSIVSLQMISRDTPFLRCQADQQSVLLDSDFE